MNRYQDKTRELTASITHVVFDPTGKPPYSLDELELMIATALLDAENLGLEKAALICDKFAHQANVDSASSEWGCNESAREIRALKGAS